MIEATIAFILATTVLALMAPRYSVVCVLAIDIAAMIMLIRATPKVPRKPRH